MLSGLRERAVPYHEGKVAQGRPAVTTASGVGKVIGTNPLTETVMVQLDESEATVELPLSEVTLKEGPAGIDKPKEARSG